MQKLLTVSDTAPILGVAIITLRRLLKKHEIPFHKIGRRYFFTEQDIETYLSKNAVPIGGVKNEHTK
jgi:excisionase family DNA binding protein